MSDLLDHDLFALDAELKAVVAVASGTVPPICLTTAWPRPLGQSRSRSTSRHPAEDRHGQPSACRRASGVRTTVAIIQIRRYDPFVKNYDKAFLPGSGLTHASNRATHAAIIPPIMSNHIRMNGLTPTIAWS